MVPQQISSLSPCLLNVLPENPGGAWGPPLLLRKYRGVGNDRTLAWGVLQRGESSRREAGLKGLHKNLSRRCREEHHEGCWAGTLSPAPGDAQPGLCFGLFSCFVSPAEITPHNDIWKCLEVAQELFGVLSLGLFQSTMRIW